MPDSTTIAPPQPVTDPAQGAANGSASQAHEENAAWKAAREHYEQRAAKTDEEVSRLRKELEAKRDAKPLDPADQLRTLTERLDRAERDSAFAEVAADLGVKGPMRELLRKAWEVDRHTTQDLRAWIGKYTSAPTPAPNPTATNAQAAHPPVGGAPAGATAAQRLEHPSQALTAEQIAQIGPDKALEYWRNFRAQEHASRGGRLFGSRKR